MEIAMNFELEPWRDLGLRHLLQNGLKIVRGGELAAERRAEVLEDLLDIVSGAFAGSKALEAESLTFALDQAEAFERFSLFFKYLDDPAENLPTKLSLSAAALKRLSIGETMPAAESQVLECLLEDLLDALERERALVPLLAPKEIHLH